MLGCRRFTNRGSRRCAVPPPQQMRPGVSGAASPDTPAVGIGPLEVISVGGGSYSVQDSVDAVRRSFGNRLTEGIRHV